MNNWRLLRLETYNAYMNMAIDEAILNTKINASAPNTIRFYRWKPSAVSIGKFQNVESEVYLKNCMKHDVYVVRRISGGGAVYHDAESEITYSVIADKQDLQAKDITEAYIKIYKGLTEALKILGLTADFNEGNMRICPNLTINGRKISGSAQCHKKGVVLQHGTLLLNVDLKKMFTFLRVPWAETCMQIVDVAKNKITSLRTELEKKISVREAYQALVKGFERAFEVQLFEGELTPYERELAEKLYKEKYLTDDWNLRANDSLKM